MQAFGVVLGPGQGVQQGGWRVEGRGGRGRQGSLEGREEMRVGTGGCREVLLHFLERGRALEEGREVAPIGAEGAFLLAFLLCTNCRCSSNLIFEEYLLPHI